MRRVVCARNSRRRELIERPHKQHPPAVLARRKNDARTIWSYRDSAASLWIRQRFWKADRQPLPRRGHNDDNRSLEPHPRRAHDCGNGDRQRSSDRPQPTLMGRELTRRSRR